ncbi:cell division protein ZapA [Sphingomonas sp.]|uniref:cell division protein ZapA n=1 Tax=Sphingomonas sp. TaxID=28214 RepID=UPI002CFBD2F6|nr:cell division protein ZapA [Sphingomonas sp.]HWK37047.1 cell division protein ZapA [Sphingomonas sp.]
MAQVELIIGGRSHSVACRDGEEAHLAALGRRLDRHAATAARASGAPGGERTMLFVALMLADEIVELENARPAPGQDGGGALLDRIADRLESVAAGLEKPGADA